MIHATYTVDANCNHQIELKTVIDILNTPIIK